MQWHGRWRRHAAVEVIYEQLSCIVWYTKLSQRVSTRQLVVVFQLERYLGWKWWILNNRFACLLTIFYRRSNNYTSDSIKSQPNFINLQQKSTMLNIKRLVHVNMTLQWNNNFIEMTLKTH